MATSKPSSGGKAGSKSSGSAGARGSRGQANSGAGDSGDVSSGSTARAKDQKSATRSEPAKGSGQDKGRSGKS